MEMQADYKIAVVIPYFGKLPNYFDLWKKSAGFNRFIDFFLITDADPEDLGALPSNIILTRMTMRDFRLKAEERLGLSIALIRPYKLCDIKPAYGKIFEKELQEYDFWGFGDLDVIWGDLKAFFTEEIFDSYDRIQLIGHLSFLRNTDEIRNLFANQIDGIDYRKIYSNPYPCMFDEFGGFNVLVARGGLRTIWQKNYVDVAFDRFQILGHYIENFKHQIFYWEDGHILRRHISESPIKNAAEIPDQKVTEFAYIHLQKRPMVAPHRDIKNASAFYITPDQFVEKQSDVHTFADFKRLNKKAIRRPFITRRIKGLLYPAYRHIKPVRDLIRRFRPVT